MNLRQAANAAGAPPCRIKKAIERKILPAKKCESGYEWEIDPVDLENALNVTGLVTREPLEPRKLRFQNVDYLKPWRTRYEEFATNDAETEYLVLQSRRPGVLVCP